MISRFTPLLALLLSLPSAAQDLPVVTVVAVDAGASEAGLDGGIIRADRTGSLDAPLTVYYGMGGTALKGGDYSYAPLPDRIGVPTFSFPAGAASVTFTVTPLPDTDGEGPETITFNLSPYTVGYTRGTAYSATITLEDDDPLPYAWVTVVQGSANESGTRGVFRISLSVPAPQDRYISYSMSGSAIWGRDYMSNSPAWIPAGASSADAVITPIDDAQSEAPDTVTLTLNPATFCRLGANSVETLLIRDNDGELDPPTVSVSAWDPILREPGKNALLIFNRTGPTTEALALRYSATGAVHGVDFRMPGYPALSIPAGYASISVPVAPIDNDVFQGERQINIYIIPDPYYRIAPYNYAKVTCQDDEAPPVVTVTAPDAAASEYGDPGMFRLTRTGPTALPLQVYVTLSGSAWAGWDYYPRLSPTQFWGTPVLIPAGAVSIDLPIVPNGDGPVEGTETVVLAAAVQTFNPLYVVGGNPASIVIEDALPALRVYARDSLVREDGSITAYFEVSRLPLYGTLEPVTATLQWNGTATAGSDYSAAATVTIERGAFNALIPITLVPDALAEGPETVTITLVGSPSYAIEVGSATLTIDDRPVLKIDGAPGAVLSVSTTEGVAVTRTLTLTNPGSVAVDWQADPRTYDRLPTTGQPLRSIALRRDLGPAFDTAFDGTSLWVTHSYSTGVLDRYDAASGEWTGTLDLHAVVQTPCGISHDEGFLWVSDSSSNRIIKFNLSTAVIEKTFTLPFVADGVEAAKGRLWAVSALNRKYYALSKSDGRIEAEHAIPAALGAWPLAFGLTYFNQYLWLVNYWDGSLLQLYPGGATGLKIAGPAPYVSGLESDGSKGIWMVNFPGYRIDLVDSGMRLWMNVQPESGTLAPGASRQLAVTFNPEGLATGTHKGFLSFPGTAFAGGTYGIIVSFRIDAAAPPPPAAPQPTGSPAPEPMVTPHAIPAEETLPEAEPSPEPAPEAADAPVEGDGGDWSVAGDVLPNGQPNPSPTSAANCAASGTVSGWTLAMVLAALRPSRGRRAGS